MFGPSSYYDQHTTNEAKALIAREKAKTIQDIQARAKSLWKGDHKKLSHIFWAQQPKAGVFTKRKKILMKNKKSKAGS